MRVPAPISVKTQSERIISAAGGKICNWLLHLDVDVRAIRSTEEARARALAMNALINIAFKAPVPIVGNWIRQNHVDHVLSPSERSILARSDTELKHQELINLHWYLESLWALMWAGNLVAELPFDRGVPDTMASLCPNLQKNEDASKFEKFQLRELDRVVSSKGHFFAGATTTGRAVDWPFPQSPSSRISETE